MKIKRVNTGIWIAVVLLSTAFAGCAREQTVSFSRDVKPILDRYCIECHQPGGAGFEASGFDMRTYESLMKGTKFGPMVIPGDAEGSNIVVLMEGRADPSIRMPHHRLERVPPGSIGIIRDWIDQGAKNN